MIIKVKTECQNCKTTIDTDFILIGSSVKCCSCLNWTIPKIPIGGTIPEHGYELTFTDFQQLLSYPRIVQLLQEWDPYSIQNDGNRILIINGSKEAIDQLWLHIQIQGNKDKKFSLYQLAMSLWR